MAFALEYSAKDWFFDRVRVQKALEVGERKALSKIGAYLRRTAQQRILRRRKRVSEPGEAPSVHSTDNIRSLKNILFAYEPDKHSVIVGPVKLNSVVTTLSGGGTVPQLLEFGGTVLIEEEQYRSSTTGVWFRRDRRRAKTPDKNYRTRVAQYQPRPFMRKALEHEIAAGTITSAFKAIISGGPVG